MIIFKGRDKAAAFPFGPYLAISGWITLLWGEELFSIYPFLDIFLIIK